MIPISNSEIALFDRCRRHWYLAYYLGTAPDEPEVTGVRILGTRVHAAMEGLYGYDLDPLAVLGAMYTMAIAQFPASEADLRAERDLASAMVEGYVEWVAETGADAGLRVIATEQDVQVPLPGLPGVALRARLDQVLYNEETGLLSFLDFKTSATFERHEVLALDPQFKTYSVLQRLMTADAAANGDAVPAVSGGMVRTLRRVKRTEKAKPPFYMTDEFRYTDTELDAAQERITSICAEILHARRILDWAYREQGGALAAVNQVQRYDLYPSPRLNECRWDCPFVSGVCSAMDDGSDWPGILTKSGRYMQADPYKYYRSDPIKAVRDVLGQ